LLAANAVRRGLRAGESAVAPRVSDLDALVASTAGKIEIESVDDGREGAVFAQLLRGAVLQVFKRRVSGDKTKEVVAAFEAGAVANTGEDVSSTDLLEFAKQVPELRALAVKLGDGNESPAAIASAGVRVGRFALGEATEQGRIGWSCRVSRAFRSGLVAILH